MRTYKRAKKNIIIFSIILLLAFVLRIYGLDWDQGQHLHPDERFLTMVMTSMKIPKSLGEYLDPKVSPMNPYNTGYNFFVYGSFPLNLTKIVGVVTKNNDYGNIHLLGRFLSAIFDVGVVILLYLIAQKTINEKVGLLAAFLYSIMVLPIQLSHFFAVDTFLNFFIVLSFYFLILLITNHQSLITSGALGVSFGLALACKVTALYFAPIIALGYLSILLKILLSRHLKNLHFRKVINLFISGVVLTITAAIFFRINQPQAFRNNNYFDWHSNQQFVNNLKETKSYDNPKSFFPPAIQWKKTRSVIFPLKNILLWGLGLPLGITAILSISYTIISSLSYSLRQRRNFYSLTDNYNWLVRNLMVFWVIWLLFYQGSQFAKTMRYFFFIYPFLAFLSAHFLILFFQWFKKGSPGLFPILLIIIFTAFIIYPISFLSIYFHNITRVAASEWIYQNIPAGSTILEEEWDDGLPLPLKNFPWKIYKKEPVLMYDLDTPEKWLKINQKLDKVDYIFLTSNRAYGSTMKVTEDYPQTIKYYQSLFDGSGNFQKIAEFTSRPCFLPFFQPLFCFVDDNADEAFTVYDHPKVMIFQKKR